MSSEKTTWTYLQSVSHPTPPTPHHTYLHQLDADDIATTNSGGVACLDSAEVLSEALHLTSQLTEVGALSPDDAALVLIQDRFNVDRAIAALCEDRSRTLTLVRRRKQERAGQRPAFLPLPAPQLTCAAQPYPSRPFSRQACPRDDRRLTPSSRRPSVACVLPSRATGPM